MLAAPCLPGSTRYTSVSKLGEHAIGEIGEALENGILGGACRRDHEALDSEVLEPLHHVGIRLGPRAGSDLDVTGIATDLAALLTQYGEQGVERLAIASSRKEAAPETRGAPGGSLGV